MALRILIRGAGDLATGVAAELKERGHQIVMTEIAIPLTVRRQVACSRAVYEKKAVIENHTAVLVQNETEIKAVLGKNQIAVLVDPEGEIRTRMHFDVIVDAIMAKKNLGTSMADGPCVIALGPGFMAGEDVDYVIETMRGHNLARVISRGAALPNTGVPGVIAGFGKERVIHAPAAGEIHCISKIADIVEKDQILAWIGDVPVRASLTGVLRGIIRDGFTVPKGMKIADIDPRKEQKKNCFTISDKARCIAGSVLEILLSEGVMPYETSDRFSGITAD